MLECCEGHAAYVSVVAKDMNGNEIASGKNLLPDEVEGILCGLLEGECPICSGAMS